MKLGRLTPSVEHMRLALPLVRYLRAPLAPPPLAVDNTAGAAYGLFRNDTIGDCTCAALANYHITAAAREGRTVSFSDDDVSAFYFDLSGGADNGLVEIDVLVRAQSSGFPLSGTHKLAAWVRLDVGDLDTLRACTSLFWATYVGAALPLTAQAAGTWDAIDLTAPGAAPGSWGGHALISPKYDSLGPTFITWGRQQRATWAWWRSYVDEAYALLDAERAQAAGVDWSALQADLAALAA